MNFQASKVSDEVSKLSKEENALVNAWWDKYKTLKKADEIRQHLEEFISGHPELVPDLELEHEVLFELGAEYIKEGRHSEYIDLLIRIREEFPDVYIKSFGYYDRDIATYKVTTGHKEEVGGFLGYFKKYPAKDPDNLFDLIYFLMANNCQDIVTAFVRDIYYRVYNSPSIIGGEEILSPVVQSYLIPYLKPDFSDDDMQKLSHQLKEIEIPMKEEYYDPDFLKGLFNIIFHEHKKWDTDDCRTDKDRYNRYNEITLNFMRFLHDRKSVDWFAAEFYRNRAYKYLVHVDSTGKKPTGQRLKGKRQKEKRPREAFVFSKDRIDEMIARTCRRLFSLDSTKTFATLNALYFFAEYLEATESITGERREQIQRWCTELFDQVYPHLVKHEFAAKAFEKFPIC